MDDVSNDSSYEEVEEFNDEDFLCVESDEDCCEETSNEEIKGPNDLPSNSESSDATLGASETIPNETKILTTKETEEKINETSSEDLVEHLSVNLEISEILSDICQKVERVTEISTENEISRFFHAELELEIPSLIEKIKQYELDKGKSIDISKLYLKPTVLLQDVCETEAFKTIKLKGEKHVIHESTFKYDETKKTKSKSKDSVKKKEKSLVRTLKISDESENESRTVKKKEKSKKEKPARKKPQRNAFNSDESENESVTAKKKEKSQIHILNRSDESDNESTTENKMKEKPKKRTVQVTALNNSDSDEYENITVMKKENHLMITLNNSDGSDNGSTTIMNEDKHKKGKTQVNTLNSDESENESATVKKKNTPKKEKTQLNALNNIDENKNESTTVRKKDTPKKEKTQLNALNNIDENKNESTTVRKKDTPKKEKTQLNSLNNIDESKNESTTVRKKDTPKKEKTQLNSLNNSDESDIESMIVQKKEKSKKQKAQWNALIFSDESDNESIIAKEKELLKKDKSKVNALNKSDGKKKTCIIVKKKEKPQRNRFNFSDESDNESVIIKQKPKKEKARMNTLNNSEDSGSTTTKNKEKPKEIKAQRKALYFSESESESVKDPSRTELDKVCLPAKLELNAKDPNLVLDSCRKDVKSEASEIQEKKCNFDEVSDNPDYQAQNVNLSLQSNMDFDNQISVLNVSEKENVNLKKSEFRVCTSTVEMKKYGLGKGITVDMSKLHLRPAVLLHDVHQWKEFRTKELKKKKSLFNEDFVKFEMPKNITCLSNINEIACLTSSESKMKKGSTKKRKAPINFLNVTNHCDIGSIKNDPKGINLSVKKKIKSKTNNLLHASKKKEICESFTEQSDFNLEISKILSDICKTVERNSEGQNKIESLHTSDSETENDDESSIRKSKSDDSENRSIIVKKKQKSKSGKAQLTTLNDIDESDNETIEKKKAKPKKKKSQRKNSCDERDNESIVKKKEKSKKKKSQGNTLNNSDESKNESITVKKKGKPKKRKVYVKHLNSSDESENDFIIATKNAKALSILKSTDESENESIIAKKEKPKKEKVQMKILKTSENEPITVKEKAKAQINILNGGDDSENGSIILKEKKKPKKAKVYKNILNNSDVSENESITSKKKEKTQRNVLNSSDKSNNESVIAKKKGKLKNGKAQINTLLNGNESENESKIVKNKEKPKKGKAHANTLNNNEKSESKSVSVNKKEKTLINSEKSELVAMSSGSKEIKRIEMKTEKIKKRLKKSENKANDQVSNQGIKKDTKKIKSKTINWIQQLKSKTSEMSVSSSSDEDDYKPNQEISVDQSKLLSQACVLLSDIRNSKQYREKILELENHRSSLLEEESVISDVHSYFSNVEKLESDGEKPELHFSESGIVLLDVSENSKTKEIKPRKENSVLVSENDATYELIENVESKFMSDSSSDLSDFSSDACIKEKEPTKSKSKNYINEIENKPRKNETHVPVVTNFKACNSSLEEKARKYLKENKLLSDNLAQQSSAGEKSRTVPDKSKNKKKSGTPNGIEDFDILSVETVNFGMIKTDDNTKKRSKQCDKISDLASNSRKKKKSSKNSGIETNVSDLLSVEAPNSGNQNIDNDLVKKSQQSDKKFGVSKKKNISKKFENKIDTPESVDSGVSTETADSGRQKVDRKSKQSKKTEPPKKSEIKTTSKKKKEIDESFFTKSNLDVEIPTCISHVSANKISKPELSNIHSYIPINEMNYMIDEGTSVDLTKFSLRPVIILTDILKKEEYRNNKLLFKNFDSSVQKTGYDIIRKSKHSDFTFDVRRKKKNSGFLESHESETTEQNQSETETAIVYPESSSEVCVTRTPQKRKNEADIENLHDYDPVEVSKRKRGKAGLSESAITSAKTMKFSKKKTVKQPNLSFTLGDTSPDLEYCDFPKHNSQLQKPFMLDPFDDETDSDDSQSPKDLNEKVQKIITDLLPDEDDTPEVSVTSSGKSSKCIRGVFGKSNLFPKNVIGQVSSDSGSEIDYLEKHTEILCQSQADYVVNLLKSADNLCVDKLQKICSVSSNSLNFHKQKSRSQNFRRVLTISLIFQRNAIFFRSLPPSSEKGLKMLVHAEEASSVYMNLDVDNSIDSGKNDNREFEMKIYEKMFKRPSIFRRRLKEAIDIKKNSLFLVAEDGTIVEILAKDKSKAFVRAAAKMAVINQTVKKLLKKEKAESIIKSKQQIKRLYVEKSFVPVYLSERIQAISFNIEDCILGCRFDKDSDILPGIVQLIECKLPLSEAENQNSFAGDFLFRQLFSSYEKLIPCFLCLEENPALYLPTDLVLHYNYIHDLQVSPSKAEFNENIVHIYIPSDANDETLLNSKCPFCDLSLETAVHVRDHFPKIHNRTVKLVSETESDAVEKLVHCSFCTQTSVDFPSHLKHLRRDHERDVFVCRFCKFCSSSEAGLLEHVQYSHFKDRPTIHFYCSMCSVIIEGKQQVLWHLVNLHSVQTGSNTWYCTKCLYPFSSSEVFVSHISHCREFLSNIESNNERDLYHPNKFFKCSRCTFTSSSEEEIKEHMTDPVTGHGISEEIDTSDLVYQETYDATIADQSTCFLCGMQFSNADLCKQHQHHVHMKWVSKDNIKEENLDEKFSNPESPNTLQTEESSKSAEIDVIKGFSSDKKTSNKISKQSSQSKQDSDSEEEFRPKAKKRKKGKLDSSDSENAPEEEKEKADKSSSLPEEPMDTSVATTTNKDVEPALRNSPVINVQDITEENSDRIEAVYSIDDLPNDHELSKLGFPKKAGYYCYLCNTLIKKYQLYYLHMSNFHDCKRRFLCVISSCAKTFTDLPTFQKHAINHSQKIELFCNICDIIFSDTVDFQNHILNKDHLRKKKDFVNKGTINHQCKICLKWFGLCQDFVKHMETDSHRYHCPVCYELFVQPIYRRHHIEKKHADVANTCEVCSKKFSNATEVWHHLSVHGFLIECTKCGAQFSQRRKFEYHFETHEPTLACPWSPWKKFTSKRDLINHMDEHKSDANMKCAFCSEDFSEFERLKHHMEECHLLKSQVESSTMSDKSNNTTLADDVDPIHMLASKCLLIDDSSVSVPLDKIQLACEGCLMVFSSKEDYLGHTCVC